MKTGSKSRIPTSVGEAVKNGANGSNESFEDDTPDEDSTGIGKILETLSRMDSKFESKFDDLKKEVREGLLATEFKVNELQNIIDTSVEKSKNNEKKIQDVADSTEGIKTRSTIHGLRLAELEDKIEMIERERRRNVIIIEGVPEAEENPSPEVVEDLFGDLKIDLDSTACDRIYRRGKKATETSDGNGRPEEAAAHNKNRRRGDQTKQDRPIVVSFKQFSDKLQVFRHLKNLQGIKKWDGVYISDDLTETQRNQLRDLRALSAFARTQGYNSSVRANALILDGRKFLYRELHRLPQGLSLEKAKTIECLDGKGVAFQSVHSPLSNLYPCNVVYKGKPFLSAEGALQYTRAVFCRRFMEASAIEFERNAYEVKRISSTFKHPPEWDNIVVDTLLEILIIKFSTNKHCREVLLATGNRKLFEATGNKFWACGLPLAKIQELSIPAPGRNHTGETVEKVREIIKGK